MKTLLLILCLIPAFSSAAKTYTYQITVYDIYSGKSLDNCSVTINAMGYSKTVITSNGVAVFKEMPVGIYTVKALVKGQYQELTRVEELYKKGEKKFTIYLYPEDDYKTDYRIIEDSLYGDDETGNLDSTSISREPTEEELKDFSVSIISAVNYPDYSIEKDESGSVLVSFIIQNDGVVTNLKIEKSVSMHLDREAIRTIKRLKFTKGLRGSQKVRARLPIVFTIM